MASCGAEPRGPRAVCPAPCTPRQCVGHRVRHVCTGDAGHPRIAQPQAHQPGSAQGAPAATPTGVPITNMASTLWRNRLCPAGGSSHDAQASHGTNSAHMPKVRGWPASYCRQKRRVLRAGIGTGAGTGAAAMGKHTDRKALRAHTAQQSSETPGTSLHGATPPTGSLLPVFHSLVSVLPGGTAAPPCRVCPSTVLQCVLRGTSAGTPLL
jgi:hypothetical protein